MPTTLVAPLMSALPVTFLVAGSIHDEGLAVDEADDRGRGGRIRENRRGEDRAGKRQRLQLFMEYLLLIVER